MSLNRFRIWADGTVQSVDEEPYTWMSDDYVQVDCSDKAVEEIAAYYQATGKIIRPGDLDFPADLL